MMVNLLMYHAGMDNLAQQVYYYAILECPIFIKMNQITVGQLVQFIDLFISLLALFTKQIHFFGGTKNSSILTKQD